MKEDKKKVNKKIKKLKNKVEFLKAQLYYEQEKNRKY